MKNSRICLFIFAILAVSCAKSRFATTTRDYHDGKVVYTNHYSSERRNLGQHKTKRPATLTRDASAKIAGNPVDNPDAINKMDLIASSDKNFMVLSHVEKVISQYAARLYPEFYHEKEQTQSRHSWDPLTNGLAKGSFKASPRRDSTVVKKGDSIKENTAGTGNTDHRITEKLGVAGFILSFLGMIPLIGIPFAVLAIIFGAVSLKRIKRNPEKYKNKGFAVASIVIGCIMILINIIIMASSISAASRSVSHASSTRCRV